MTHQRPCIRILSLDGGGIRGLVSGLILQEIVAMTGVPACDGFDLFAGTSTGSLIAFMLTLPKPFSAEEIVSLYSKEGPCLFQPSLLNDNFVPARGITPGAPDSPPASTQTPELPPIGSPSNGGDSVTNRRNPVLSTVGGLISKGASHVARVVHSPVNTAVSLVHKSKYSAKHLEAVLEGVTREHTLKALRRHVVVPAFETSVPLGPFVFTTFDAHTQLDRNYLVKHVARASTAAPTYFPAVSFCDQIGATRLTFVDGGLVMNNPAAMAYTIATKQTTLPVGEYDVVVVSIGTGSKLEPLAESDLASWGVAQWVKPLIDMTIQGSAEVADVMMRTVAHQDKSVKYFRFNPEIPKAAQDLGDASEANMTRLRDASRAYLELPETRAALRECADALAAVPDVNAELVHLSWRTQIPEFAACAP